MTDNTDKNSKYEATMARLRESYIQDLPERFSKLEEQVLVLEQGGDIIEAYDKLFRDVHSLKGSGGTYGFPVITNICHLLEDVLKENSEVDKGFTQEVIDSLLKYVDLLHQFPACYQAGEAELARLQTALNDMQGGLGDGGLRCLIVEGSETTRTMISLVLGEEQVELSLVNTGIEALERLLQEPFDMLITGMAIGTLNGKALIAATRLSDSVNAAIPAILLTSSGADSDASSPAADVVLEKGPATPLELLESFRKLV